VPKQEVVGEDAYDNYVPVWFNLAISALPCFCGNQPRPFRNRVCTPKALCRCQHALQGMGTLHCQIAKFFPSQLFFAENPFRTIKRLLIAKAGRNLTYFVPDSNIQL
jgi:hypothetical protein